MNLGFQGSVSSTGSLSLSCWSCWDILSWIFLGTQGERRNTKERKGKSWVINGKDILNHDFLSLFPEYTFTYCCYLWYYNISSSDGVGLASSQKQTITTQPRLLSLTHQPILKLCQSLPGIPHMPHHRSLQPRIIQNRINSASSWIQVQVQSSKGKVLVWRSTDKDTWTYVG